MENIDGSKIVSDTFSDDEAKLESITRRITVKVETIDKMRKISSLFSDDMGKDVKEPDMISFFLEIAFESFLRSGAIEQRVKSLTGVE